MKPRLQLTGLADAFLLPPLVLGQEHGAEVGELVGWVVEAVEDDGALVDRDRDQLSAGWAGVPSGAALVLEILESGPLIISSVAELAAAHAEGHRAAWVGVFLPSVAAEEADDSTSRSHGLKYRTLASRMSIVRCRRVMCSPRCLDGRFRRLHAEAYAAQEAAEVERHRERRRKLREGEAS